jgi:histidine phosphotransfer protein HptB
VEAPVNLDNLRIIADGDRQVEAMLLDAFLEATNACLNKMQQAFAAGDEAQWRQQAHAFKGACLNLGADPLSNLCNRAQIDWRAAYDEKKAMLQSIEAEFARVKEALDHITKTGPKA